ncbi:hypothetical protein F4703DRAFT_1847768 [Phycomyces blakesleeanus]
MNPFTLPPEIIAIILSNVSLKDLVRIERTSKKIQSFCLWEIGRRIKAGSSIDAWAILIHLGQTKAIPTRFDPKSKMVYYSVPMDPIEIHAMFDHRRQIPCFVFCKESSQGQPISDSANQDDFNITVEQGMVEGKTVEVDVKGKLCQIHAALTRVPTPLSSPTIEKTNQETMDVQPIAPSPLTYIVKVTEMCLPLSHLSAH